jgi:DNA polymerase III epsilon subunit-like protein
MTLRDILVDNIVSTYVQNLTDAKTQIIAPPIVPVQENQLPSIVTQAISKRAQKLAAKVEPTCVLVFDTETTGVDKSARIVQLACALYKKDENNIWICEKEYDYLINP